MASRQEEKEQRKRERLEREAQAAATAKRKRFLQLIGGVVVALAIAGGLAFAVSQGGGGSTSAKVDTARLNAAADAAGCTYRAFPSEGRNHVTRTLTPADYKTNPPTSGQHNPVPAADGLYVPGNEPPLEHWVHTLEHGRVEFQYRPGTSASVIAQLTQLFNENVKGSGNGYHSMLFQNNTKMPFAVAAVAWQHYMACKTFTPQSIDALRTFRDELIDKGPETVP
jgi:hypothetical protein